MIFVTLTVLASSLLPATALFLLTSYRRWLAYVLCALPPLALALLPELHYAVFAFLCSVVTITATLLLVLIHFDLPRADRARFLLGGIALMLVASIPAASIVLAAAELNPESQFCRESTAGGDCPLDYLKLVTIGMPLWGSAQTILFSLVGEGVLIAALLQHWKSARRLGSP